MIFIALQRVLGSFSTKRKVQKCELLSVSNALPVDSVDAYIHGIKNNELHLYVKTYLLKCNNKKNNNVNCQSC